MRAPSALNHQTDDCTHFCLPLLKQTLRSKRSRIGRMEPELSILLRCRSKLVGIGFRTIPGSDTQAFVIRPLLIPLRLEKNYSFPFFSILFQYPDTDLLGGPKTRATPTDSCLFSGIDTIVLISERTGTGANPVRTHHTWKRMEKNGKEHFFSTPEILLPRYHNPTPRSADRHKLTPPGIPPTIGTVAGTGRPRIPTPGHPKTPKGWKRSLFSILFQISPNW